MIGTLIGYFPKRSIKRSSWVSPWPDHPHVEFPAPQPVEEICSVSDCIAEARDSRMDDVPFNPFGGYHSPSSAWQAVGQDSRRDFDLFAYRLAQVLFRDGREETIELPPLEVEPLPNYFERLGYDAAELGVGPSFGCSPLSCNGQASEERALVTRYCLVANEQEGLELARAFSLSKPEPGPYCVVEVWRDAGSVARRHAQACMGLVR